MQKIIAMQMHSFNPVLFYFFLPIIIELGAHTSTVSFLQVFITQWYSKEEHEWLWLLQFLLLDLSVHSSCV